MLAVASGYEVIDLGTAGGATSAEPTAIRDDGTVVGILGGFEEKAGTRGFVYANGVMGELPYSGQCCGDEAHAINRSGHIAGQAMSTHTLLVWGTPDAPPRRLDTGFPSHPATRVIATNERDEILTNVEDDVGNGIALIWRADVPEDLGGLEGASGLPRSTFAADWNAQGQVVGRSRVARVLSTDRFHPFVWEGGAMRDLCGALVDCRGRAMGINASGAVVGDIRSGSGLMRAFVWDHGVLRDLGAYPGEPSRAVAINDRGQILGVASTAWFLWENGSVVPIEAGQGSSLVARALGRSGEVVGDFADADGELHAFVWQDGRLTDLGPGSARALNARGDIIGTRGLSAILWRRGAAGAAAMP